MVDHLPPYCHHIETYVKKSHYQDPQSRQGQTQLIRTQLNTAQIHMQTIKNHLPYLHASHREIELSLSLAKEINTVLEAFLSDYERQPAIDMAQSLHALSMGQRDGHLVEQIHSLETLLEDLRSSYDYFSSHLA